MYKVGNLMFAYSGGLGIISFFFNKDSNIFFESFIFVLDQVIYQWKEKKNVNLD